MIYYGRWWVQGDFSFAASAVATADVKVNLSFETAFVRGILANILVCMAIWLAMAGRTVTDKLLGIVLPVTTFIHSSRVRAQHRQHVFRAAGPATLHRT